MTTSNGIASNLRPGRAGALGAGAVAMLLVAAWWSVRSVTAVYADLDRRATISTVDAVPLVIRGALVLALLWAILVVLAGLRVVRSTPRELPGGLVGRVALVLLAATMTTTLAGRPAGAQAATLRSVDAVMHAPVPGFGSAVPRSRAEMDDCAPVPGWTAPAPSPTRARGAESAPLVTGCAGSAHDGTEVVVRRGDSLWSLVGRELRTDDPAVIAAEWPRWYTHNRQLIGPDPDLLQVGRILHRPEASALVNTPAPQGDPR
ncbi:LysM peptidoglycan-binding domain-containing protein [Allobranchiibius sp. GilTou73]|uniref:LysM peptidoglycan-binding domain-containing protein n=1 Tax=Allobranchiibius sp. GilTou73 TaxID=2904523 RepID=UPI001F38DFFE|nr:hypothetical protein [Allobranchiibius sp. GilTou73]UIJ34599.1 hypothetical protein LVQ62_16090 [Allobranchiibius sp. GilTou73]